MQTLGVASAQKSEDNFFQRLFWPSVENQYDVDLVSRRAFWVALCIGLLTFFALLALRMPLAALFTLAVFVLGASGMRQRSVAASILICVIYTVGKLLDWVGAFVRNGHAGVGLVSLVCIALLLTCVRASFLSCEFAAEGDDEFPDDDTAGLLSRIANRLPRHLWPRFRVLFFVLAALCLAFTVFAGIYAAALGAKQSQVVHNTSAERSAPPN